VYVYDCPGGSSSASIAGCALIGSNVVLFPDWNTTGTWATHDISISTDATLFPLRQLRLRVLVGGQKLWVPLVGPYVSSLDFTG
jgi:hypothetical protein